jgi:hypothetical protein
MPLVFWFYTAPEIIGDVKAYEYMAIYPDTVSGARASCTDLVNAMQMPDAAVYNVIQRNSGSFSVVGNTVETATLPLPNMEGMLMFAKIVNGSGGMIGLGCTSGVAVPGEKGSKITIRICQSQKDKLPRCKEGQ